MSLFVLRGRAELAQFDSAAAARWRPIVADAAKWKQAETAILLLRFVVAVRRGANQLPRRQPHTQANVLVQFIEQIVASHGNCRECEERRRLNFRALADAALHLVGARPTS